MKKILFTISLLSISSASATNWALVFAKIRIEIEQDEARRKKTSPTVKQEVAKRSKITPEQVDPMIHAQILLGACLDEKAKPAEISVVLEKHLPNLQLTQRKEIEQHILNVRKAPTINEGLNDYALAMAKIMEAFRKAF